MEGCDHEDMQIDWEKAGGQKAFPQKSFEAMPSRTSENVLLLNRMYIVLSLIFLLRGKNQSSNSLSSEFKDFE